MNNWLDRYMEQMIVDLENILTDDGSSKETKTELVNKKLNAFAENITIHIASEDTELLFYTPLLKLRNEIINKSLMRLMEKEYTNWALHICIDFIDNCPSQEMFDTIYQKYKEFVLYKLGLLNHTRGYFYNEDEFDRLLQILECDSEKVWNDILRRRDGKKEVELYPQNEVFGVNQDTVRESNSINTEVAVALAADNNYALPMMVTIASMIQTASESSVYSLYLLVPGGFGDENKDKIKKLCSQRPDWKVNFVDMQSAYKTTYISISHVSTATYYRLQLPSLLKDVEKCIYMDVDLVVKKDLSTLFLTDIKNRYLAGVRAAGYYNSLEKIEYQMNRLGVSDFSTYVNAGVLVMNLKKMRDDGLEDKFSELIEKKWESQDQDILNVACLGHIRLLNAKYNAMTKYPLDDDKAYEQMDCLKYAYSEEEWEEGRKDPVIIHYADSIKPWNVPGSVYAKDWWRVVSLMPTNIASDIYNNYMNGMLANARQVKQSLDYYEKSYKEVKKQGAFENERIYKYKLEAENREQKKRIKEEKEIANQKIQEMLTKQDDLEKEIEKLNTQLHEVKQSRSYRIGRACTFLPRKIKKNLHF